MYCTHCGKQLDNGAVFCPHCGCSVVGNNDSRGNGFRQKRKTDALSVAGLVTAIASIALGFLSVWINGIYYTRVNFQFFFVVPLAVAFALSIAGVVKAKKQKTPVGAGVAGILISGFVLGGALLYFLFAGILAKLFFTFVLFLISFLL